MTTSVGAPQDLVGHGLTHANAGELGDLVVEALEVLDVHGREHVDVRREHVVDVLIALAVLDARRVGVGELVDQAELRGALENPRQVHLLEHHPVILDAPPRQHLEALEQRGRRLAPVGLGQADRDVAARLVLRVTLLSMR